MSEMANSVNEAAVVSGNEGALERRIFRAMLAVVALVVIASSMIAPWRVTTGLLLGGALSIFNHHWLRTSIAAAFNVEVAGSRPRVGAWRYIVRYFIMFAIVFSAYTLNIISLPAVFAGLCSFVVALFAEAFRQIYFIIIRREETN
jgi:hypothetical protein